MFVSSQSRHSFRRLRPDRLPIKTKIIIVARIDALLPRSRITEITLTLFLPFLL